MELEQVGKKVKLDIYAHAGRCGWGTIEPKIIMGIKAPRGRIFLFKNKHISLVTQCNAIKAFMTQHKDN